MARWWAAQSLMPCSEFIDTLVPANAEALSLNDILSELLPPYPLLLQTLMLHQDYISLQTLVLPLTADSLLLDMAANSRFWTRMKRITPPQQGLDLELPGFWVQCSPYVLQTEPCVCELPAGGVRLLMSCLCATHLLTGFQEASSWPIKIPPNSGIRPDYGPPPWIIQPCS